MVLLSSIKIDNMREEHQEKLIKDAEKIAGTAGRRGSKSTASKEVGFISVSIGEGFGRDFHGSWCGLPDRRWTDDESEYGRYAECDQ